jgi:hypothetical protein
MFMSLATDGSINWLTAINNTNSSMEKEDRLRDGKLDLTVHLIFMLELIALLVYYKVNC